MRFVTKRGREGKGRECGWPNDDGGGRYKGRMTDRWQACAQKYLMHGRGYDSSGELGEGLDTKQGSKRAIFRCGQVQPALLPVWLCT